MPYMQQDPEMVNWALARIIKEAREQAGFTQNQLAGFAGLSEVYLSSLERGQRGSSLHSLLQLSKVLNIPAWELVRRVEEELGRGPEPPAKNRGRPRK